VAEPLDRFSLGDDGEVSEELAIFGLGRSGLGVAKAAQRLGIPVHIYDQAASDRISKPELLEEVRELNLPITLGWHGTFQHPPKTLVVNPAVPTTHAVLKAAEEQGVEVIGEIEFAFRISKAPIVGITGTNGKSTTTVMTYLCLRACDVDAVLCGNIFGSGYEEVSLTDAASNSTPEQILVAEISSFQLDTIKNFRPIVAGITNIWPDHLDRYPTFRDYAAAKHRIFENQKASDFAVVRANDPAVSAPGRPLGSYVPRGRRRSFQSQEPKDLPQVLTFGATGKDASVEERDLVVLDKRVPLDELLFQEPHNFQNAAMASLLSYGALLATKRTVPGVLPECVIHGLGGFRGLAHRMELVGSKNGVRVINNSMCTNPDAVIKSVQAVRDRTHLLMGGVNKNLDFGPLRHYLANQRHQTYLYGRDSRELSQMLGGNMDQFATLEEAFQAAAKNATTNEVIMLAPGCASMDAYRDFRHRGDFFRTLATEWLKN
jgi:UDP-N-acetylmuramoylalanine--D-glutamate ligase